MAQQTDAGFVFEKHAIHGLFESKSASGISGIHDNRREEVLADAMKESSKQAECWHELYDLRYRALDESSTTMS
jgi:hypothetical protein